MDKMREEFEAWFSAENGALPQKASDGGYYYTPANDMWTAWQASRAALCVKLPTFENGSIRGYSGDCEEAHMVVDCVGESLEKAGVSYE